MRPCDSVAGTRCTRCTPPSYFSRAQTPSPGLGAAAGLHRDRDVLVAAEVGLGRVEDLGLPAAALGVAQVHPQQVAGEQRRLLAALARLDLEDDVLVVVGVARHEQPRAAGSASSSRRASPAPRPRRRTRRPRAASSRAALDVARRPASRRGTALDDRGQLGVAPAELAGRCLVGVDRRVGELGSPGRRARRAGSTPDGRCSTSRRLLVRDCARRRANATAPVAAPVVRSAAPDRRWRQSLLLARPWLLAEAASKRATRPPVSRIFCLPV